MTAALALVAPGTGAARRPGPGGQGQAGSAGGRGRQPRGAVDLLRRLPHGRRVHAPAPGRAVQDGLGHHPHPGREPHRQGQRAPGAGPVRAHQRDRHPPPHGRAGGPLAGRPGDLGERGHGRDQRVRGRLQAHPGGDPPAAGARQPGPPDAGALQGPPGRRGDVAHRLGGGGPRHPARRGRHAPAERDGPAGGGGDPVLHRRARCRGPPHPPPDGRAARGRRRRPGAGAARLPA